MSMFRTALHQFLFVYICLSCLSCSYRYTVTVEGTVVLPNESPIDHGYVTLLIDSRKLGEAPLSPNGEFSVVGEDTNPRTTKDSRGVIWLDEGNLRLEFIFNDRKFEVKNLKAIADSTELKFFCSATLVLDDYQPQK